MHVISDLSQANIDGELIERLELGSGLRGWIKLDKAIECALPNHVYPYLLRVPHDCCPARQHSLWLEHHLLPILSGTCPVYAAVFDFVGVALLLVVAVQVGLQHVYGATTSSNLLRFCQDPVTSQPCRAIGALRGTLLVLPERLRRATIVKGFLNRVWWCESPERETIRLTVPQPAEPLRGIGSFVPVIRVRAMVRALLRFADPPGSCPYLSNVTLIFARDTDERRQNTRCCSRIVFIISETSTRQRSRGLVPSPLGWVTLTTSSSRFYFGLFCKAPTGSLSFVSLVDGSDRKTEAPSNLKAVEDPRLTERTRETGARELTSRPFRRAATCGRADLRLSTEQTQ